MDINQIIDKHYSKLRALIKVSDIPIYNGNMTEDIFQNCILTALNKFQNEDIDEELGLEYLKRIISNEIRFSYRKKKKDKLLLVENLLAFDKEESDD